MSTISYKCPNCGGGLAFDPAEQKFGCEYCLSLFTEKELEELEAAKAAESAQEEKPPAPESAVEDDGFAQHAAVYSCPSCGAEVVCEDTTAATFCYYCHNPVVLAGRLVGGMKPDKVIPFALTKEQAQEQFLAWARKKMFIPRAFFCKEQIEKVSGVYFPYWLMDCDVHGRLDAKATRIRVWRVGDTEYTETKWFHVTREGSAHFADISRNALKKANSKLAEGVQPFDTSKMIDFSMSYLSGFQAEKRDIEYSALEQEAQNEVNGYVSSMLRNSIQSYSAVMPGNCATNFTSKSWRYALLPVWVLTYNGNGKTYYYAMNGQTGRVCGVLPLDWKRLAALAAAVAVPLFGLLTLGGYLL